MSSVLAKLSFPLYRTDKINQAVLVVSKLEFRGLKRGIVLIYTCIFIWIYFILFSAEISNISLRENIWHISWLHLTLYLNEQVTVCRTDAPGNCLINLVIIPLPQLVQGMIFLPSPSIPGINLERFDGLKLGHFSIDKYFNHAVRDVA